MLTLRTRRPPADLDAAVDQIESRIDRMIADWTIGETAEFWDRIGAMSFRRAMEFDLAHQEPPAGDPPF